MLSKQLLSAIRSIANKITRQRTPLVSVWHRISLAHRLVATEQCRFESGGLQNVCTARQYSTLLISNSALLLHCACSPAAKLGFFKLTLHWRTHNRFLQIMYLWTLFIRNQSGAKLELLSILRKWPVSMETVTKYEKLKKYDISGSRWPILTILVSKYMF